MTGSRVVAGSLRRDDHPLVSWPNVETMKLLELLARSAFLLMLLAVAVWTVPALAQTEEPTPQPGEGESIAKATEDASDLLSDIERLLRHERIMELDQAKLAEVREELTEREKFFNALGEETFNLALQVEEKRKDLASLGERGDPEKRSALEVTIQELEADLELFKTQSDLELTAEKTIRQQIESLEKKLERHRRAADALRGGVPAEPRPTPSPESQAPAVAPGGRTATMRGVPIAPGTGATTDRVPTTVRLESTAQLEAQREVERTQLEMQKAEQAVVEYVKRRESLQQQIQFESVLLDAAERSAENLDEALQVWLTRAEEKTALGAEREDIESLQRGLLAVEDGLLLSRNQIEKRQEYLGSLKERLARQQREQDLVTAEIEARREELKEAEGRLYWLQSPLHPANVTRWFRERGPRILFVIMVAFVLLVLLRLSVRRIARVAVRRRRGERALTTNRADTLALSFRSAATVLILIGGILLVFQEAGFDVKTVLGGAAILGFAVAFGAQNLVRDYFTGFMILLEDQYELGDLVTIEDITGTVEKVNMRTTMLRDLEGRVHFIPNGEVKSVTNRSYVWGRAVIEVPVGYKENVDHVMEVLLEVAEELRADPEFGPWITDDPVMLGVDKFTDYGVVIKFMLKTLPDKMFPIRRQMLRRVKNKFDDVGIEISVPHRMLLQPKQETDPGRA